jgi:hypothetical protein
MDVRAEGVARVWAPTLSTTVAAHGFTRQQSNDGIAMLCGSTQNFGAHICAKCLTALSTTTGPSIDTQTNDSMFDGTGALRSMMWAPDALDGRKKILPPRFYRLVQLESRRNQFRLPNQTRSVRLRNARSGTQKLLRSDTGAALAILR